MYKAVLMDHFRNPRNKKSIEEPDFSSGQYSPSCGDSITIEGKIEKDKEGILRIKDLGFDGFGCVISIATASLLTQHCIGKRVDEVLAMKKDDILKLLDMDLGHMRIKCALLSLEVLKKGLEKFKDEQK